jgi:NADH-quinone oxidoreductase subunit E
MLRRLYADQPASFAFTPANADWARRQIAKYPEGRQASAVIPLLWRAQEQEGWVTKPAIEEIARMLSMAPIRVVEVASFYFMFQLAPVGSVANVQICGTTPCMLQGSEALVDICRRRIAPTPHTLSADGRFSWEEVECLGACSNAPMAQIGKDYYEDLTPGILENLLDRMQAGEVPRPGPQQGRFASEPASGLTSLTENARDHAANGSVERALAWGDTLRRITGDEQPQAREERAAASPLREERVATAPSRTASVPPAAAATLTPVAASRPAGLEGPRGGKADDLKLIVGIGPKLEKLCHSLGYYHFDQIAAWTEAEVAWVDDNLEGFKGRVTRDRWVAQAGEFAARGGRA